jgi:chromosome segregation ATPase
MENQPTSNNDEVPASSEQSLSLDAFSYSVNDAATYLLEHGFRIAPRTISWHCQTNLLDCEKFVHGNVQKWKITKDSLDDRIQTLKREGFPAASNNEQKPASLPASNSEQKLATESELGKQAIKILTEELHEKNKQIDEFQSIIHDHNQQFENLNKTIQLSNQTIQQINSILALPQVKDVMQSMREPQQGRKSEREAFKAPVPDYSNSQPAEDNALTRGPHHQSSILETGDLNANSEL